MTLRMPAEWAPHERTIMCWPARETMWQERFAQAQADHAAVANAIAAFEPVLMAADPRHAAEARRRCGAGVEVVEIPLDDSWARDSGPIFVAGEDGERAGRAVRLQRLGREVHARTTTTRGSPRACSRRSASARRDATHFILEGGSITVDGEGTLDHHGAVPARGAPQPAARARGDRGRAARPARRRARDLARARARRGRRHRRPRRQHLRVRRARQGRAPDGDRRGEPQLRARPGQPAPAARRPGSRSSSCPGCPTWRASSRRSSCRTRTSTSATAG